MTAAFFDEPYEVGDVAMTLLEDNFYIAAYVVCGNPDRWQACVDQLGPLFVEFMNAQLPDEKLYKLAVLMFRWSFRLKEGRAARNHLAAALDFLDQQKVRRMVARQQNDDGWKGAPWTVV